MTDSAPKTFYLPHLDRGILQSVLGGPQPDTEYVSADYTIVPAQGIKLAEAIARSAIVASTRAQRHYLHETPEEWLRRAARCSKHDQGGYTQILYPSSMFNRNEGVSKLLAVLTCGGEHDFVDQFWLQDFELPEEILKNFLGPQFGIDGLRKILEVDQRPILGVTVRPLLDDSRFQDELKYYGEALEGGADYLTDDILFSDGESMWALAERAKHFVNLCNQISKKTKVKKSYVANISIDQGNPEEKIALLNNIGVSAIKINAFYSGFGTLQSVRSYSPCPIIATNIGVSLLTRPAGDQKGTGMGVAEAVISRVSRICGADAVHLGSVDTGTFVLEAYDSAITNLAKPMGDIKPAMAVLGDNINASNIWQNLRNFGGNVLLESSSGIMSYASGPKKAAGIFRDLAEKLADVEDPAIAHSTLMELANKHAELQVELTLAGYDRQYEALRKGSK